MALGKSLFKSSIKPCPPREVESYVCGEIDFSVAKDEAVNGYICSECILDAVSAEMAMISSWRWGKVRHPVPNEFTDMENH